MVGVYIHFFRVIQLWRRLGFTTGQRNRGIDNFVINITLPLLQNIFKDYKRDFWSENDMRIVLFGSRDTSHNKRTGMNKYGGTDTGFLSILLAALDGGEWTDWTAGIVTSPLLF